MSLPTIHGCASGTGEATKAPVTAKVVDHTAYRCPKVDSRQRDLLRSRVKPPQPDQPDGVSRGAMQAKIDELRRAEDIKGKAGLAIADELDRCAGHQTDSKGS